MTRPNQYPENPHPAGTFLAAQWDLNRAFKHLGVEAKKAAIDDARRMRAFFKQATGRDNEQ